MLPLHRVFGWLLLVAMRAANAGPDFSHQGPFEVKSSLQSGVAACGKVLPILPSAVLLTYPVLNNGTKVPLLFMYSGFALDARSYQALVNHTASWGFFIVQCNDRSLPGVKWQIIDNFIKLVDWLSTTPLGEFADASRLGVMGHSRGGKVAALQFALQHHVQAAVLIDPVDCDDKSWLFHHDELSAVAGLQGNTSDKCTLGHQPQPIERGSNKTAAVIGSGRTGDCNPRSSGYEQVYKVLADDSWQLNITQAGHLQFADLDYMLPCQHGNISARTVMNYTATMAVAWLKRTFNRTEYESGCTRFESWLQALVDNGTVIFNEKRSSQQYPTPSLCVPQTAAITSAALPVDADAATFL